MKYLLSGFSDECAVNFDEQLENFRHLGIEYAELRFVDGTNVADLSDEQMAEVERKLREKGISVSAIGSPIGKIGIDEDFTTHLEKAKRVFAFAARLHCRYVRVFSFYLGDHTRGSCRAETLFRMNALLDLAEEYGVTLCHENEEGIYGFSPEQCLDLLTECKGRLRAVFDMGNFRLGGFSPIQAYEVLKEYIEYFHIKDATESGEIVPCGEGDACIAEILKKYAKEYPTKDTFVSLEPHLVAFTGLSSLATHELEQKYSFETPLAAFTYATKKWRELL